MPPPASAAAPDLAFAASAKHLEAEGHYRGVTVKLPLDLGKLEFSPRQARGFASSLMKAARDADDRRRIKGRPPVHLAAHSTAPSSTAATAPPAVLLPAPSLPSAPPDLGNAHSPDEELSMDANGRA